MKIAVATDFSERSIRSFQTAGHLARQLSASVDVLYHFEPSVLTEPPPVDISSLVESAQDRLADLVKQEATFEGLDVTSRVCTNRDLHSFADELKDSGVDLLIVTAGRHTGFERFLLGSFAERIVRAAPCDVLVLRSQDFELPSKHLLLTTDLSAASIRTLVPAFAWARVLGGDVRLLHVVDNTPYHGRFSVDLIHGWNQYEEAAARGAQKKLDAISQKIERSDVDVAVTVGNPILEILDQAAGSEADCIVLGTHPKSALDRFYLGTVAEHIVRRAQCPVLVVRRQAE